MFRVLSNNNGEQSTRVYVYVGADKPADPAGLGAIALGLIFDGLEVVVERHNGEETYATTLLNLPSDDLEYLLHVMSHGWSQPLGDNPRIAVHRFIAEMLTVHDSDEFHKIMLVAANIFGENVERIRREIEEISGSMPECVLLGITALDRDGAYS